jgi:multisubunit Na+/H+ antiporter MnhB subunit
MKQPNRKEVYTTIIILALAAFALKLFFHVRYADDVAFGLLIIALAFYQLAVWITIGWLKFAEIIGTINSKVLLSVIFFLFLFPIAMLYGLTKKDPLQKKKLPDSDKSYYHLRNHNYQPDDFKHTF